MMHKIIYLRHGDAGHRDAEEAEQQHLGVHLENLLEIAAESPELRRPNFGANTHVTTAEKRL